MLSTKVSGLQYFVEKHLLMGRIFIFLCFPLPGVHCCHIPSIEDFAVLYLLLAFISTEEEFQKIFQKENREKILVLYKSFIKVTIQSLPEGAYATILCVLFKYFLVMYDKDTGAGNFSAKQNQNQWRYTI